MPPQPLSTLATARIPATAARRVPVNEFKLSIRISASIGIAIGHPLDCPVCLLHFAPVVSIGVVTETARTLQDFRGTDQNADSEISEIQQLAEILPGKTALCDAEGRER